MTDDQKPVVVWFRQDLRIADNPALCAAIRTGQPVLPVYIHDDTSPGQWKWGGASRWWLHHSLTALQESLGGLTVLSGPAEKILPDLCRQIGAQGVYWNRCYEPFAIERDKNLKESLPAQSFKARLLFEPWEIRNKQGKAYKVYTPFANACFDRGDPGKPLPAPKNFPIYYHSAQDIGALKLLPKLNWDREFYDAWMPGEAGAQGRLKKFLNKGIDGYARGRDFPGQENVSRLSPHLHWGEISPRQIWHAIGLREAAGDVSTSDAEKFKKEILWREFSHHLLYDFPDLPLRPLDGRFAKFPWKKNAAALRAWQKGQTGYPIVDAGMRQLWRTGWMHNRVRMIVASFLIKDLLIPWQRGEEWFWNTLLDADLANNAASWQWVAGCGADAAPFFRIFNPVMQGEKFDPVGRYVRKFVPELAALPDKFIHKPWAAPHEVLEKSGVRLGKTYPHPIVDHSAARADALKAFGQIK